MPAAALAWRLRVDPPASGVENMATDEALLDRARLTGEPVLRLYAWSHPTLSLGRHQRAAGHYDLRRTAALGVDVVRRLTGGRAVLHHHEITYSITAPDGALGSPRESYRWINRLLVEGLCRLGVPAAEATDDGRVLAPDTTPCFAAPAAGELVAGGRKLVGSAQYRERGAWLQHGSILVEDDQGLAADLLDTPAVPPPRAATLKELLGRRPSPRELAELLSAALVAAGMTVGPLDDESWLSARMAATRDRYTNERWTWRR